MKKIIICLGVVGLLAFASSASAATITSNAVFDGQTQVYGNAGSQVQTTFQVEVPAGQVLHAVRTKVDSQPTVCTEVGPFEGAQTVNANTTITLPPNTNNGGYSLVADLYYTDTLPQAQAMTGDLACTSSAGGSHVNTGAYNGGTVVNVLPSSGSTGNSSNTQWAQIWAAIQALTAAVAHPATTTPPVVNAKCTTIAPYLGATPFDYSPLGVQLQSALLLDNPLSIPALAAGATIPMGFFGPQTHAALANYNATYHCN